MDLSPNSISIAAATSVAAMIAIFSIKVLLGYIWGFSEKGEKIRYVPVVGTVLRLELNFSRLYDYMTDVAHKHKTYRFLYFFRSHVFTSDPANVEYILKTNFSNFGKGLVHHEILTDFLGDGIFTVDGEKWRRQRKSSSFEFSTKMLKEFSNEVFKTNGIKLAHVVSQTATSNQPFDVQELLMKSTLDSILKVVLGMDVDTLGGTSEQGILFTKAFDKANEITTLRYFDAFWKIKRFLNIGLEAKLRGCVQVIDRYVYQLIKSKTEQLNESPQGTQMLKRDILSRFLDLNETDPKYLKDIILNFIIAGKDTTASTLSWFLYMMCKHPLIQERIAQEVKEATNVTGNPSFEELAASIDEDALNKMQYLHAALTETLRLYPAVPVDGKLCMSDDTFPDGCRVRKGDMVAYQPYVMGRMKWIWGDDAEDFRPQRWLNQHNIFQQQSPFKFTAFQAGPRICLGKDFAYRQMKIFSAILISSFIFKLSDEQKEAKYRTMFTLHIDGGLHLRACRRSKSPTSSIA